MARMAEEKFPLEQLSAENWSQWKFKMMLVLKDRELFGHCDGSLATPDTDAAAAVLAAFEKGKQKALTLIALHVSNEQLYLVSSCTSPAEAWKELCQHYEKDTIKNKLVLKKRLYRLQMGEGATMVEHLKGMKEITDRLSVMGSPVADEDQVAVLLCSLPSSYSMLSTAIETKGEVTMSYISERSTHQ